MEPLTLRADRLRDKQDGTCSVWRDLGKAAEPKAQGLLYCLFSHLPFPLASLSAPGQGSPAHPATQMHLKPVPIPQPIPHTPLRGGWGAVGQATLQEFRNSFLHYCPFPG